MGIINLDKIKISIGETVFNHISSLDEFWLRNQRKELVDEISLTAFRHGKNDRYYQLLDEYFFINYRLESNEQLILKQITE